MIPGSKKAKRGASAVSETVSDYGQKKVREDTDDNAALDAAGQMELAGESLARKSIYVRERLKENRQRNNRLRESVLEEMEKSSLQFGTSASNEAKKAVQKEAEQKKLRKAYLAAIRKMQFFYLIFSYIVMKLTGYNNPLCFVAFHIYGQSGG